ncbi:TetR/AcrR family transcriptional regulator [Streptomyces sp. NPDC058401]|uniref:TetR/AcrR family transcriptional regulator n=1 Tax=Streptomyces sp. NPDC058401 TaxID=3346480 RepID=UPI0036553460
MPSQTAARQNKPRRNQEERSAATRLALLDATIEILAEEGYAALTVTKVAARAGVTSGARVHHFGNRDAMVAEAIGHLAVRLGTETLQTLADRTDLTPREGLDTLWEIFRGPVFQAVLQFSAASPIAPQISERLHLLDRAITKTAQEIGPMLFAEAAQAPGFEDAVFTALNAMSGLALTSRITGLDSDVLTLRWTRTRDQLLRLFEAPA